MISDINELGGRPSFKSWEAIEFERACLALSRIIEREKREAAAKDAARG